MEGVRSYNKEDPKKAEQIFVGSKCRNVGQ